MRAPFGILYSQVGYDLGAPKRLIVRGGEGALGKGARLRLSEGAGAAVWEGELKAWGALWGSEWWVADFSGMDKAGSFQATLLDGAKTLAGATPVDIGQDLLWSRTAWHVGPGQLERRRRIGKVDPGWYDAGTLWQEANSHASMILGLCQAFEAGTDRLNSEERKEWAAKIQQGCDYIGQCQDHASKNGMGEGAVVHDLAKHPDKLYASDVPKCALAWSIAARVLKGHAEDGLREVLRRRAEAALKWFATSAKPWGAVGFEPISHGWPKGRPVPLEWMTRDLLTELWAEVELARAGRGSGQARCAELAAQVLARQVPKAGAEDGLWGHFYSFNEGPGTEKSWSHGIIGSAGAEGSWGHDIGATFAHPVAPLLQMADLWKNHADAGKWLAGVEDFAQGYFKPACQRSPFLILPLGVFGDEGLLHFAGVWHGMNCSYGQAAALGFEFARRYKDPAFRDIAVGNLQWVAGLNAGLTNEAQALGTVCSDQDIPPGTALPISMILGCAHRDGGSWLNIRGSIANGFGTGAQFKHDVEPTKANDGPHALHDEDWITHGGGWLMGLAGMG